MVEPTAHLVDTDLNGIKEKFLISHDYKNQTAGIHHCPETII